MSAAAGVSRSTFLRYFDSKEDAILSAFEKLDDRVPDAWRTCPAGQGDWTALRHAVTALLEPFRRAQRDFLPLARLVEATPALSAGRREKQVTWRNELARALAERGGEPASERWPSGCGRTAVRAWTNCWTPRSRR
ncbi:TetR/AcrR family transcriptional regulator [Streptomyces sp. CA-249302]|uniref:TetR/AcrR family transcriptional regulator n=1 Tax=Streptomyces sp. CA-249302 TaxID=3240058 RepID=UPI003D8C6A50